MKTKKKVYVWYEDFRWELVKKFRPTKHETFLLLRREETNQSHADGITPVDMCVIDVNNHEHAIETPRIKVLRSKLEAVRKAHKEELLPFKKAFDAAWFKSAGVREL